MAPMTKQWVVVQSMLENVALTADRYSLSTSLLTFHGHFALMCDAFASVAADEDSLGPSTAEGARHFSEWQKNRADAIRLNLKRIQER